MTTMFMTMRSPTRCVIVVALLLAKVETGIAMQTPRDGDLAGFRAKTPGQKVRASTFDQPNNPPLRPNQTRFENEEWAIPPHDPPEYSSFIRELVCQSDLVVVGRAIRKQSFMTETDSSIFTDYSFAPEESLRGGAVYRQPTSDTTVEVSLRGGTIQTPSGPIEVKNEQPLDLGDRSLLFLKRIPKTSSFELSGPHFTIAGGTPRVRSRHELPAILASGGRSTNAVLEELRAAAAKCQKPVSDSGSLTAAAEDRPPGLRGLGSRTPT
jgi:hypothetical protein